MTDKRSTVLCTTMSTLLVCSSQETGGVVLPGATAVTTPVSETRATLGSAEDHCIVRGLTTRPPCPGTTTCSVSTSLGPSATGLGSRIAMSLGCTTTGAVAVRPGELVTCTVPWPADNAPITPFWSTFAMPGRRHARFDDGDAAGHAGDGAVVVDAGDRDVVRGPDEPDGRDDVARAVERSGEEAAALPHFHCDGWWSYLNFGHVLGDEAPGKGERDPDHKRASRHNGANVNARKCRCQANLSPRYRHGGITAFTRTTPPGVRIGTSYDEPATPGSAATSVSPARRKASRLRALERSPSADAGRGTSSS